MIKASLLAIVALGGYAFQSSGEEAPALQRRLETGKTIFGDLSSGRQRNYDLIVAAGNFFRLTAQPTEVPV
ncbi:MAG: hypothetical protein J2P41_05075, partial [Blastocatellia bacterium]|nr:hypothetical protein [Blastocatellia bacterium]